MKKKFYILIILLSFLSNTFSMQENSIEILNKQAAKLNKITEALLEIKIAKSNPGLTAQDKTKLDKQKKKLLHQAEELKQSMQTKMEELLQNSEKIEAAIDNLENSQDKNNNKAGFCTIS